MCFSRNSPRWSVLDGDNAADLVEHGLRQENASRVGYRLQSRGDIDGMTAGLTLPDHDLARVDADAEVDPLIRGQARVAPARVALHPQSALQRLDRAGELGHQAVSRLEEHAAVVSLNLPDDTRHRGADPAVRRLLVGCHEDAIALDISAEDRGKPTFHPTLCARDAGRVETGLLLDHVIPGTAASSQAGGCTIWVLAAT